MDGSTAPHVFEIDPWSLLTATTGSFEALQVTADGTGTPVINILTTSAAWPHKFFLPTVRK